MCSRSPQDFEFGHFRSSFHRERQTNNYVKLKKKPRAERGARVEIIVLFFALNMQISDVLDAVTVVFV